MSDLYLIAIIIFALLVLAGLAWLLSQFEVD
jgi:hypothetical protein